MDGGTILVITMCTVTVASAVAQKIMVSMGKVDESAMLDLTTKSGLAVTALTVFAKVIKAMKVL